MASFVPFFRTALQKLSRSFGPSVRIPAPFLREATRQRTFRDAFEHSRASYRRPFHTSQQTRRQAFSYRTFQGAQSYARRWAARPTFKYEAGGIAAFLVGIYVVNLEQVPISGRYRFRMIPYDWEAWQGQQMYAATMEEFGRKIMPAYSKEHRMVERVMQRLIPHSGLESEQWEVHVIDSEQKNAFVIPGGKVFVFRGILDVAQGEDGLAAVLGHEIAHNVAHHAAERMSQSVPVFIFLLGLSLVGLDPGIGNFALNLAFTLPGSRSQESEADYVGLMMMSESCYDPHAAMGLWSRMEAAEEAAPLHFLSTHPSNHNRLEKIQEWLPKAEGKLEAGDCGTLTGRANDFRQQVDFWRR